MKSLNTRLVLTVLATATLAFSAFVALTFLRLSQGLDLQATQLSALSEEKLAQKLDGEARLARARVETLMEDMGRRLETIAQRTDIVKAIASGNGITISEPLGRAARSADIDGILVIDPKLRVIGADVEALNGPAMRTATIDILATSRALAEHPIAGSIGPLVADNDRNRPRVHRQPLKMGEPLARAIGAKSEAPMAFVMVQPVFDEFGDVFAALVAHRALRPTENTLLEFSNLQGSPVVVLADGKPISTAKTSGPVTLNEKTAGRLLQSQEGNYLARCAEMFVQWRVCSLALMGEVHALRDELVRIGTQEGRSLVLWLFVAALLSLALFALITLWASQRITRPLMRITAALVGVARGDWKSEVAGTDRRDEVGDIARAVMALQRSLEERDRLRSDVLYAETVVKRREALEDAIRRFDRMMRSMLLSVSDSVEAMDGTARELARMSSVAEGEAAEAAFVSESTVSNVSSLRNATEYLSGSLADTAERLKETAEGLTATSTVAQSASTAAAGLQTTADELDEVIRLISDITGQINAVALNATIQASRTASGGHLASVASDLRGLSDRIGKANAAVADRMSGIRDSTEEAVASVKTVAGRLGLLLNQTTMMVRAMERQDAVTRKIVDGMSAAANGSANVSTSVGRLKTTIEEAREASMKVVSKATDMADEAHRLDSTVKSFLREVTN